MSTRDAHKPTISDKTNAMAMRKRQKMLGENTNVTIVELLLQPTEKNEHLEKQRSDKKKKEEEECTFKPKTLTYHSGAQQTTHGDKCLDLYSRTQKG